MTNTVQIIKGKGYYKMSFSHVSEKKDLDRVSSILKSYAQQKVILPQITMDVQSMKNQGDILWVSEHFWALPHPNFPSVCYLLSRDNKETEDLVWGEYLSFQACPEGDFKEIEVGA